MTDSTVAPAPFSLDEPTQGALEVRLQIGAFEYCMSSAGGEPLQDRGQTLRGAAGLFKVRDAPAPLRCP